MESSANVTSPVVTVWSERNSPRLSFVLDWLLVERLGLSYTITQDKAAATAAPNCLAYGPLEDAASIHATSLLWETGIVRHPIHCAEWQGLHTLYFDDASLCDIRFDMLAGIFYLLTRYEEYFPFTPDRHGRYPAEQSILHPVLERPVVDEWVEALRLFLEQVWNVTIQRKPFFYQPTYDIDIAWSYRFKGWRRSLGAALKDAANLKWSPLKQRMRVCLGTEADPYDSFVWIMMQHMDDARRPIFFILAALQPSAFDKNISPRHPRMAAIIQALSTAGNLGLHPSYYSDEKHERLLLEKRMLGAVADVPVRISRQHFIKLRFPQTYRALLSAGIDEDYSMGYSTQLGFRAGTGSSFLWYDLQREAQTALRVYPFAFMDSTAHYDLGLSAEESFDRLRHMAAKLQACGGTLISIMHNFSLGTEVEWRGWRRTYERFLTDIKTKGNQL